MAVEEAKSLDRITLLCQHGLMENPEQNGHKNPRMDRLEGMMELLVADHVKFADEHSKLLTSQILLTASMDKLGVRVDKLAASMEELRDVQKATDERMSALLLTVDGLIRNRPSL
jgi:hypothetical protein